MQELRRAAKQELLTQGKRHDDYALLCSLPGIGPLRATILLVFVGSPHRFRTKRQFCPYCGLAVITPSSADHQIINGTVSKRRKAIGTRGLNPMHVPELKQVFKDAALTVVLQKISRDTKILNVTSVQAATSKRSATNLTCPRMSPFPIPSTCPFRIMFMAS